MKNKNKIERFIKNLIFKEGFFFSFLNVHTCAYKNVERSFQLFSFNRYVHQLKEYFIIFLHLECRFKKKQL